MKRVAVTGIGLVTPLGAGTGANWGRLLAGESGLRPMTGFVTDDLPCRVAGQVPGPEADDGLDVDALMPARDRRRLDQFIIYAIAAADEAIRDSGWAPGADATEARNRTGVMIGSGIGGLQSIYDASVVLEQKGPRRITPFFIPSSLINLASGQVSIRHGFRGPNHSVVTACATGMHAIGDAARIVRAGMADVMVAGGAEASVCRLGIAGFAAMRALSTRFNDSPARASRPWDEDRDGFVMGEGAGIVVLEEFAHAQARGARIYGEIKGYGMSGDAHHISAPAPDGDGGYRSMRAALEDAGMAPGDIDYLNAHGTSTPPGRRDRARRHPAAVRPPCRRPVHQLDEILHRAPPRRGRGGGDDLRPAGGRARRRAADPQPRPPLRRVRRAGPRAARGPAPAGAGGAVQLVRVRRHQRIPHRRPRRLIPCRAGGSPPPSCWLRRWRRRCCTRRSEATGRTPTPAP